MVEVQLGLFAMAAGEGKTWHQLPEDARQEVIELLARLVLACATETADEVRDER